MAIDPAEERKPHPKVCAKNLQSKKGVGSSPEQPDHLAQKMQWSTGPRPGEERTGLEGSLHTE